MVRILCVSKLNLPYQAFKSIDRKVESRSNLKSTVKGAEIIGSRKKKAVIKFISI